MIASLMMYGRLELDGPHDRFWQLIREGLSLQGIDAPIQLSNTMDAYSVWTDPELILSMTCSMPFRTYLHDKTQLVGTPDYGIDGCPPGYYRSAFIVRKDDPREIISQFKDAVFAHNGERSQSGYVIAQTHLTSLEFWFHNRLDCGTHLEAAQAVADSRADIACIEAVTWRQALKYESVPQQLRVIEWTSPSPGLPYISSKMMPRDIIFEAVKSAISALKENDRAILGIKDIIWIPKETYLGVPGPYDVISNVLSSTVVQVGLGCLNIIKN